jgi:hypothetical protein
MAALGVYVSLKPQPPNTHTRFIVAFIVLFLCGGVVNVIQTQIASNAQKELQARLEKIQKNTETPAQVTVNVPQPPPPQVVVQPEAPRTRAIVQVSKILVRTTELVKDQPLSANIFVSNIGSEAAYRFRRNFVTALVPVEDIPEKTDINFRRATLKKILEEQRKYPISTLGVGEQSWSTVNTDPVTQEQLDGFLSGKIRFYVYIWARWQGAEHDLDSCTWVQSPGTAHVPQGTPVVLHTCN